MQRTTLLLSFLVAAGTLLGEPLAVSFHDALAGLGGARPLPAAVVRAADPVSGRAAAVAAGAGKVWIALPDGDERLDGASPDPGTLAPGPDGRIRFDGSRRLPLPEGLDGILRLDAAQIGPGTPATLLAGRAVVVVWEDPALGRKEASPGRVQPVDRGELLAVALGAARAGAHVRTLPLPAAAMLVALVTLGAQLLLTRVTVRRGAVVAALAVPGILAVALLARVAGVDLPWLGLTGGLGLAVAARAVRRHREALATLDRIVLRLGGDTSAAVPAGPRDPELLEAESAVDRALARRGEPVRTNPTLAPASA